jgi:predicted hotdog family 3-hydroxylacyl-ACP dehydratase
VIPTPSATPFVAAQLRERCRGCGWLAPTGQCHVFIDRLDVWLDEEGNCTAKRSKAWAARIKDEMAAYAGRYKAAQAAAAQ